MKIADNCVVEFRYTLLEADQIDGVNDPNEEPLEYVHGQSQIIPGLEAGLAGREAGEHFTLELAPEQAYGLRDEENIEVVEREVFAGMPELKIGLICQISDEDGKPKLVRVKALDNRQVTLDLNHPYAGQTLRMAVDVVSVREGE